MHYLERVRIPEQAHKFPGQLSGGQQQRVAIARALCMKPKIMLFDEPTSALDPEMVKEVLDTMIGLAEDGMTMLCVTHEMGFARTVANRVIFMDKGEIVEQADVHTLFSAPQHPYTRRLLDAVPRVGGRRLRDRVRVSDELEAMTVDASATPVVEATDLRIVYPGRLRQPDFTAVELAKQMQKLGLDPAALENAATRARSVGRPHAVRDLADHVESLDSPVSRLPFGKPAPRQEAFA